MMCISLGWGTQSFGLAAMSALGELPHVDAAIHADTGHEASATYEFAARWTPWLEAHGVRVVTVRPDPKYAECINAFGGVMLPAYTNAGRFPRQCTSNWKIYPIRRWLQANRNGERVQQWIGITADEAYRVKPSDVQYIEHVYPYLGLRMAAPGGRIWSRHDVISWLQERELEVPPRSACVFCPFQSTHEWQRVAAESTDWARAVAVDRAIRSVRPPGELYVHRSLRPLEEIDFTSQPELDLWGNECSGMCGV